MKLEVAIYNSITKRQGNNKELSKKYFKKYFFNKTDKYNNTELMERILKKYNIYYFTMKGILKLLNKKVGNKKQVYIYKN